MTPTTGQEVAAYAFAALVLASPLGLLLWLVKGWPAWVAFGVPTLGVFMLAAMAAGHESSRPSRPERDYREEPWRKGPGSKA